MKDAEQEDWNVDEDSSGKELFKSWKCENSHDSGPSINGALGAVQAPHGRYVPPLNQGGGIALVRIIMSEVGMNRKGRRRSFRGSAERTAFLSDNHERLSKRVHVNQGRFLGESFRCDGNLCEGPAMYKNFNICCTKKSETHKEHTPSTSAMEVGWAETVTTHQNTFWKHKRARATGRTCFWQIMAIGMKVLGSSFLGVYTDAASNLEARRVKKPE